MAQLCLTLPPFTPDYSGAGALLFDLKSLTVMHDAGGCTGNYTGHDEPRWYGSDATVFCSALRMIDVIMGNDEKLKSNVLAAIKDLKPELITLIGSPVPMVIGMDLKGLAVEIENETGIPTIGIETTGTQFYDIGEFKAAKALLDKFTVKKQTDNTKIVANILGATPLDYECEDDISLLQEFLISKDIFVNMKFGYGYSLNELQNAAITNINIAVSYSGYLIAKYMEAKYGIPYICGYPYGADAPATFYKEIINVLESGRSAFYWNTNTINNSNKYIENRSILILGEQVISNSLRKTLSQGNNIQIGCLFNYDEALAQEGDVFLSSEKEIRDKINEPDIDLIIADPILMNLLSVKKQDLHFYPFPQYAISGDLYKDTSQKMFGEYFNYWWQTAGQNL